MNQFSQLPDTKSSPTYSLMLTENGGFQFDPCVLEKCNFAWPIEPLLPATLSRKFHSVIWDIAYRNDCVSAKVLGCMSSLAGRLAITISTVALADKANEQVLDGFYYNPNLSLIPSGSSKRKEFSSNQEFIEKVKDWIAYRYQKVLFRTYSILGRKLNLAVNSNNVYDQNRVGKIHLVKRLNSVFDHSLKLTKKDLIECENISVIFSRECCKLSVVEGVEIDAERQKEVERLVYSHLSQALIDYRAVERFVGNRKFNFFAGSLSAYRPGLFALHARINDGSAYGTCHGVGPFTNSDPELSVLVNANTVVAPNKAIYDDVKSFLLELPEHFHNLNIEETNMGTVFSKWNVKPQRSSKIQRIAIMGRPVVMRTSAFNSMGFGIYLKLEKRICNLLNKCGYEVVYKAHPESDWVYFEDFFGPDVKVDFRPFGDVVNEYDAVFYDFSVSTTFTTAMFEGLHIFMLADGWHDCVYWNTRMRKALSERCNFIQGGLGKDGYIEINDMDAKHIFLNPKNFNPDLVYDFLGDDTLIGNMN